MPNFKAVFLTRTMLIFMAEPFILLPVRFRWIKVRLPKIRVLPQMVVEPCMRRMGPSRLLLVHSRQIDRYSMVVPFLRLIYPQLSKTLILRLM